MAAAVTEIGVAGSAAPTEIVEVNFDRPFLVRVAHAGHQRHLFLATIRDPSLGEHCGAATRATTAATFTGVALTPAVRTQASSSRARAPSRGWAGPAGQRATVSASRG